MQMRKLRCRSDASGRKQGLPSHDPLHLLRLVQFDESLTVPIQRLLRRSRYLRSSTLGRGFSFRLVCGGTDAGASHRAPFAKRNSFASSSHSLASLSSITRCLGSSVSAAERIHSSECCSYT